MFKPKQKKKESLISSLENILITLNYDKKLEVAFKEKQQYLGYNLIKNLEIMPLVKKENILYNLKKNLIYSF